MFWTIFGIFFFFLASLAYAAASGAPWAPTWQRDVERAGKMLDLKPGMKVYELGSGDGRICFHLAKTGADIIGIELSIGHLLFCWLKAFQLPNVWFRLQNAFKTDLRDADVVYMFLFPEIYEKFREKFERELRPGTKVLTYVWPIEGWKPVKVDECENAPKIYLYEVPDKAYPQAG